MVCAIQYIEGGFTPVEKKSFDALFEKVPDELTREEKEKFITELKGMHKRGRSHAHRFTCAHIHMQVSAYHQTRSFHSATASIRSAISVVRLIWLFSSDVAC